MSQNTATVETYLDGFRRNDHAQILSCLTDDIEWTVFGAFHLTGKAAYDAAIEGSGFTGPPRLEVVMRNGKIAERRAWVVELKENDYR
jgi:ketosteroid isomerase-like protein